MGLLISCQTLREQVGLKPGSLPMTPLLQQLYHSATILYCNNSNGTLLVLFGYLLMRCYLDDCAYDNYVFHFSNLINVIGHQLKKKPIQHLRWKYCIYLKAITSL